MGAVENCGGKVLVDPVGGFPSFVLILLTVSAVFFSHCSTGDRMTKELPFESIHFGKSQTFTNVNETYLLVSSGVLYKAIDGEFTEIGQIKRSEMRVIGQELTDLQIRSLELNEVGTITYFLEVKTGDETESISWTPATLHPGVKDFYALLLSKLE